MKYYQEILLHPTMELSVNNIWSLLYEKIHLALVKQKKGPKGQVMCGLSFPEYSSRSLGTKARIFGMSVNDIEELSLDKMLSDSKLHGFVQVGEILSVPEKVQSHAVFVRRQGEDSLGAMIRRQARRHGSSVEQEIRRIAKSGPIPTEDAYAMLCNKRTLRRLSTPAGKEYRKAIRETGHEHVYTDNMPFVNIRSASTNHRFRLIVDMIASEKEVEGSFTSYGLGNRMSVPIF